MDETLIILVSAALVAVLFAGASMTRRRRPRGRPPAGPEAPSAPPEASAPAPKAPPKAPPKGPKAPPARPEAPQPPTAPRAPAPPAPPAPARPAPAPPAPPAPEAPPEGPPTPVPVRVPLAARLRAGLSKSRNAFATIAVLGRRDRLDDAAWEEVEETLIASDMGVQAAMAIVENLRRKNPSPAQLQSALKDEIVAALGDYDRSFRMREGGHSIWLVTGVNGTGKTTSIAKLANRMQAEGRTVALAAADTFRAAAIDQLGVWAERLGVHMIRHAPGADPSAVIYDAVEYASGRSIDLLIADTAGRLHTRSNLMEELKKIRRVAGKDPEALTEVLLVIDATVGQNGIAQARNFSEAVDVTGVILTKLDGSAKGGVVVAVQQELGIPVKAVGIGEAMDDLAPFDPETFAGALLEGAA